MQEFNSNMTRKINNSYTLGQSNAPSTGGDMLKTRVDGTLVWEGVDDTDYLSPRWYGDRGIHGGGAASPKNRIQYITIPTMGNATDFGDLYSGRENLGALSNGTRGVFGGGEYDRTMEYITVASTGNATDFGDLPAAFVSPYYDVKGCCNGTRGLFAAGRYATADNPIAYITVSTTGNAADFGDLSIDRYSFGACADSTRALFGGGQTATGPVVLLNIIDYVAFSTTGDAADFGDLSLARNKCNAMSDTTRGVWSDGEAGNTSISTIDYVTIASTGNATDFGNRTANDMYGSGDATNNNYGVIMGGTGDAGGVNVIDRIVIQTTGNAVDFGNLLNVQGYGAGLAGY